MPNTLKPPRWARWLLENFGHPDTREEVQGDLLELYTHWVQTLGRRRANWRYTLNALKLARPLATSTRQTSDYAEPFFLSPAMIQNYLTVAWRHITRNRLLSSINVIGLALGMSCSLIIWLWISDELSINKNYKDADRIYFVRLTSGVYTNDLTPGPLAEALRKDVPDVAAATRFWTWPNDYLVKVNQIAVKETGLYVTDDFFTVFQHPVLRGNPGLALKSPNAIVITRRLAEKFFKTMNAIGRTLQLNNDKYYRVGAVVEDVPKNASIQFDWAVNSKVAEDDGMKNWGNNSFRTYIKLQPNSNQTQAETRMKGLLKHYQSDLTDDPILQPISDVYLYSDYVNGKPVGGRISYVRTFGFVALLILLIACVNFMNLATARASLRAKEVGIRKVIGAMRLSLVGQFLGESIVLSLLAVVLAVALVASLLPLVNQFVHKQLTIQFTEPTFWLSLLALIAFTSLVAGSYPALFLSAMQPIRILKGKLTTAPSNALFRKSLVVFQFTLSLLLIVGMLVIGQQMQYIRTKHLGLDRSHVLWVPVEGTLLPRMEAYRQEIQRSGAVISVTTTGELPVQVGSISNGGLTWPGKDPKLEAWVYTMKVGFDFARTMQIQLVDGRDFTPSDSGARYLVNESAAKLMNLKHPVGTEITYQIGKGPIVGVMKDFHLRSLHEPIRPLVLSLYPKWTSFFLIKTRPGQTDKAIRIAEQTARQFNPAYPFSYHFLDDDYEKLYRSETLVNTLINYFGFLAILISCLGLFGLATFTAEQRAREIGVRKVLGASVTSIVALLSTDFIKLVFIAILIASPLAWYGLNQWLQNFAYRISIGWWVFALAGLTAVTITLLTVSFQSIKAALVNPIESLRSE